MASAETDLRRRKATDQPASESDAKTAAADTDHDRKPRAAADAAAPTATAKGKAARPAAAAGGAAGDEPVPWSAFALVVFRFVLIAVVFTVMHHYFSRFVLDPMFRPGVDPAARRQHILSKLCPNGGECAYELPENF